MYWFANIGCHQCLSIAIIQFSLPVQYNVLFGRVISITIRNRRIGNNAKYQISAPSEARFVFIGKRNCCSTSCQALFQKCQLFKRYCCQETGGAEEYTILLNKTYPNHLSKKKVLRYWQEDDIQHETVNTEAIIVLCNIPGFWKAREMKQRPGSLMEEDTVCVKTLIFFFSYESLGFIRREFLFYNFLLTIYIEYAVVQSSKPEW